MIEATILSGLMHDENYMRKVYPFLKEEYFVDLVDKALFRTITEYIDTYNGLPSKEALKISIDQTQKFSDQQAKEAREKISGFSSDFGGDIDWLVDQTEKFCQDKAIYNAVRKSIQVLDGEDKRLDKGAIPQLLADAIGVSFDTNIGHDFIEDFQERFEFYHRKENKVEFDITLLNEITKGGISKKSLSVILASTGVGKTLAMCHFAAANLMDNKNVLYITMEMAEERIAERIDANLLDCTVDELHEMPRDVYASRVQRLSARCKGKLIVKEYPTSAAGSNHFRHLLNELKLKRKFVPDIIYIDYLNICASSRMKMGGTVNSYTYVKAIAEELRGLAVEHGCPIVTATQSNRDGANNSDIDLTNTSESWGLPATADFMFALISTEELEQLGQLMIKQLKNRWGDPSKNRKFVVGIDRSRMRLYDADDPHGLVDDTPVMSNTGFGSRDESENKLSFGRNKFKQGFQEFL